MNNRYVIYPRKIKLGAKFGFFSPSDPIYPRRVEFINNAVEILTSWGFKSELITDKTYADWSVLRSPLDRVTEFHSKIENPEFDCLIATWGGKNSNDLINLLDYDLIRKKGKPIVGSSDIAVLLNAITFKTGLVTFYGPNVLGKLNQTNERGFPLLRKDLDHDFNLFPSDYLCDIKIIRRGECRGRLIGGSLGTFTLGLCGNGFIPQFPDVVFFFETASLDYYRIRQHLCSLNNSGFLKNVVGVIVGNTNQIAESDTILFEEMLLDIFHEDVLIVRTDLFGHGFYYNPTLPIGCNVIIDTDKLLYKIDTEEFDEKYW